MLRFATIEAEVIIAIYSSNATDLGNISLSASTLTYPKLPTTA